MIPELSILIRLQEIDNQLMEIEEELGDLPEQIEKMNVHVESLNHQLSEQEETLDSITTERKQVRTNIDSANARLVRTQSVILSVKTTREYDAITSEIEQAKSDLADNQIREIKISSQIHATETNLEDLYIKIEVAEKDLKLKNAEMKERVEATREEQETLNSERAELVGRLPRPLIAHYERIRTIRDGIGVAQLNSKACGYCYSVLPQQRQAEVKKMEDTILCEVCGCILVSAEGAPNLTDAI